MSAAPNGEPSEELKRGAWYSAGVDHYNIVGHPFGVTPGFNRNQFYLDLVAELKEKETEDVPEIGNYVKTISSETLKYFRFLHRSFQKSKNLDGYSFFFSAVLGFRGG